MSSFNNVRKIAVFHALPPGGGKRLYEELTTRLRALGYKQDIYTIQPRKFNNFIEYLIYVLFWLNIEHKGIAKVINRENYRGVLVFQDYLTKAPYILNYLAIPSIYFCLEEPREFYFDREYLVTSYKSKLVNFFRLPLKWIDRINLNKATVILTNSLFSQKKLTLIYKQKFSILPQGVNTRFFRNNKDKKREGGYLVIGSTSVFKGIDFLIRVISKLPKKYQYELTIIGSKGRDHTYITSLASKLKVKINLLTDISDQELLLHYQNSKLLLAAARNEPFGLSLIEATSCGLQIVATNEGGYKEILRSIKIGELVERDVDKFKKAILNRLRIKVDEDKLHEIACEWNWEESVKTLDYYIRKYL